MSTSQTYGTGQAGGAQGTGSAVKDTAKEQASQVGQSAGQAASQVADTSKQQVQEVASEAKAQARDLAGELKTQVNSQAGAQKERAVTSLHSLSDELEKMARGEGSGEGTLAEIARQGAQRIRQVASTIEGREPADLVTDLRSYASRRPTAFLAGAALAGLLAGRLTRGAKDARSSAPSQQGQPRQLTSGYSTGTSPSTGSYGDAGVTPYGGTGAPPLGTTSTTGTSATGHDALGTRNPTTGPLATDDVLDLDAPTGRPSRGDAPGGGVL